VTSVFTFVFFCLFCSISINHGFNFTFKVTLLSYLCSLRSGVTKVDACQRRERNACVIEFLFMVIRVWLYQWRVHWNFGHWCLFSVNGSLKCRICFQWMASVKIQINILFSVKHSLKCWALDSISSERFTETITSYHIEKTDAGLDGLCIREISVYHTNL